MTWLTTFSGKHFNFLAPDIGAINKEDIAQALSNECRFGGHIPQFYSVAQHSVLASYLVPRRYAREALLHDAVEAYCKDIPQPLKGLLPDYQRIERQIDHLIRFKYALPLNTSPEVKMADLIMLATERRDLDIDDGSIWPILEGIKPADILIHPLTPSQARSEFLKRWDELFVKEVSTSLNAYREGKP
ncbi:HD family hydrolase [Rouxiella badensis]|uniref:HD family hydrolase n=1 Tax=Rouxiella badensis TaxID=1646377 RepID=UPI001D1414B8|nr:HD family hydrolase [Rouxiella badensis]MCC3745291.1 HD family hydrolase [Rouxiella badensis]